jgi:hypothetical protein
MIWVSNYTTYGTSVYSLSSNGIYQATYATGCNGYQIASDAAGNVWSDNVVGFSHIICKTTPSGTSQSFTTTYFAGGMAVDAAGNAWGGGQGGAVAIELNSSGSLVAGEPSGGWADPALNAAYATAIDAQGNAWFANDGNALATEVSPTGSVLSGSGYSIAHTAQAIAIDGNNSVWTANYDGSLSHLSNAGAAVSPAAGYKVPGNTAVNFGMALDPSGNVWTTLSNSTLLEWVGVAGPVVTPLAQNLVNSPNTLGQRP